MLLRSVLVKARKIGQPVGLANPPSIAGESVDFFLLWASSVLCLFPVSVLRIPRPAWYQ